MDRAKSDPLATPDQECGVQIRVSESVSRTVGELTDGAVSPGSTDESPAQWRAAQGICPICHLRNCLQEEYMRQRIY